MEHKYTSLSDVQGALYNIYIFPGTTKNGNNKFCLKNYKSKILNTEREISDQSLTLRLPAAVNTDFTALIP